MEKRNHSIDQDFVNAELFGNDIKDDSHLLEPASFLDIFKHNLYMKIVNANTDKDLDEIGSMLDQAINNKYNINVLEYQLMAAKKMTQIENAPKYGVN
ncbi:MAG: hypothetical protein ACP5NZ_02315 [Nanobdellota archaeon]